LSLPRIIILGAGVAGLRAAKKLNKMMRPAEGELILIDQNDYHQLLYRLHKTCNYTYERKDIVVPLKDLIGDIDFRKTTVENIDPESKIVKTNTGDIPYDILLVAMGSHPTFFNIEGIQENSMTLSSYEEAKSIREKIFSLFENAEKSKLCPNIVLGGAGFTGIELAGELLDCLPKLCNDHRIDEPQNLFTVVEALPTILPGWNDRLIDKGQTYLENRKVKLILKNPIVKVGPKELYLKDGTILNPDLFIWTGGVCGDPACGDGFQIRSRRIAVDEYLRYAPFENIFIAGDQACTVNKDGQPMPPNAHIAMMQADVVVENVLAQLRNKPLKKYEYAHAGEIVTFGKRYAVGEIFGVNLDGLLAKIMKQFIHVWYLDSIGGFGMVFRYW
jgi:NADH dehydrogenase